MKLLERYLKKIGVEDYSELSNEEKVIFNQWEKELRGTAVTLETLATFIKQQQTLTLAEFEDFANDKNKDLYLKMYSRICRQILSFIEAPEKTRKLREEAVNEKLK